MQYLLSKIPRVLVAMPLEVKANQDKLKGILHYAQTNGPWDVQFIGLHPVYPSLGSFRNWLPDGIIHDQNVPLPSELQHRKIPIVRIDGERPPSGNWVVNDSARIAETAFAAFQEMNFRNFAYVDALPAPPWSETRKKAFVGVVARAGHVCSVYAESSSDWGIERHQLMSWLQKLPKPCAVMVAMDLRARQVLDVCREAEISVPDEIAVIGVDDDTLLCESTTPPLTSILPDFEAGGFIAARLLDDLMRGRTNKRQIVSYGVKRLVARASARRTASYDIFAEHALEIIRLNACDDIDIPFIVRSLNVSRRYAEIHFKKATGKSLLEAIQDERMSRLAALLLKENRTISQICDDCGYLCNAHLKRLFRKRFGMSMREYRNRARNDK